MDRDMERDMAENTGYWKVVNPYLTPKSKHKPLHPVGAVVATADLGKGEGVTEEQFVTELRMIGAIVPAEAPEKAPETATQTAQVQVQAAPKPATQAPVVETSATKDEAPA